MILDWVKETISFDRIVLDRSFGDRNVVYRGVTPDGIRGGSQTFVTRQSSGLRIWLVA